MSDYPDIRTRLARIEAVLAKRPTDLAITEYVLELEDHLRWTLANDGLLNELHNALERQLATQREVAHLRNLLHTGKR